MVSGVIIAGGKNSRMGGRIKALLTVEGERLIDRTMRILQATCNEVIIVTNSPEDYVDMDCVVVGDIYTNKGPLAGIHSGLVYASHSHCLVVASDMPFLEEGFIRHLISQVDGYDIVVPTMDGRYQPLHAIYGKSCRKRIERLLKDDERKITGFYRGYKKLVIAEQAIAPYGEARRIFANINSPNDWEEFIAGGIPVGDKNEEK
ncbi:MAG: molybdenum cofactor guanylyltransferase [Deltaproteobacteria bacterium]|nr:molybdenum cofactor guanylyltransferase [Deltaproteobacteria bacterium]